jgi:hypothetical protein
MIRDYYHGSSSTASAKKTLPNFVQYPGLQRVQMSVILAMSSALRCAESCFMVRDKADLDQVCARYATRWVSDRTHNSTYTIIYILYH